MRSKTAAAQSNSAIEAERRDKHLLNFTDTFPWEPGRQSLGYRQRPLEKRQMSTGVKGWQVLGKHTRVMAKEGCEGAIVKTCK